MTNTQPAIKWNTTRFHRKHTNSNDHADEDPLTVVDRLGLSYERVDSFEEGRRDLNMWVSDVLNLSEAGTLFMFTWIGCL